MPKLQTARQDQGLNNQKGMDRMWLDRMLILFRDFARSAFVECPVQSSKPQDTRANQNSKATQHSSSSTSRKGQRVMSLISTRKKVMMTKIIRSVPGTPQISQKTSQTMISTIIARTIIAIKGDLVVPAEKLSSGGGDFITYWNTSRKSITNQYVENAKKPFPAKHD